MKSLKFTIPTLILVSIIWGLPIAHADALPNIYEQSYINYNYDNKPEVNTSKEIISTDIITNASSYWATVNDTHLNLQWPLKVIDLPALDQFEEKEPILVAILDTGIDKNHEDLRGKVIAEINFSDSSSPDDLNGHGTFIAGIITANINNQIGIAGISPNCRLLNVKVADDEGNCTGLDVARGIVWATDNGAKIINVSIELNIGFRQLEEAVNYAWERGALVISVASNKTTAPVYPAFYENCIAVLATDKYDNAGPLTGYGDWVDIAAPGLVIYSTLPFNSYGYESGTSFAVAHVSGLASLLFGIAGDTNFDGRLNDEVRWAILNGAEKININTVKRINATESIRLIQ